MNIPVQHLPRVLIWFNRLRQVPRWLWYVLAVPLVIFLLGLLVLAVVFGLLALVVVLVLMVIRHVWRTLMGPPVTAPTRVDDGRENVRVIARTEQIRDVV